MNLNVPLYAVLLILGVPAAAYAIYRVQREFHLSGRRTSEETAKLCEALSLNRTAIIQLTEVVAPACSELRSQMAGLPKLLEAVAKIGAMQVELIQQAQRERTGNPFGKTNGPKAPRDVEQQNLDYDVMQIMRAEGITREEALLRLNGANQRSVWDGGILEGWNR